MKTLAYLDCPTGISGDMCLGALVHAGVPLAYLEHQLAQLGIADEFQLEAESVQRNQQAATKLHIKLTAPQREHTHTHENGYHHQHSPHQHSSHQHGSRRLPDIELLIQQADIPERAAAWSLAIFRLLAKAEARVHGIPPEKVHFHEVGATDAIVDIVGTCLGLDWLDVDQIGCSPLPTGGGTVRCEHGLLPVPAPAVLSMMATANIPVYGNGIEKELVTPTGCAIAAALCQFFGPPPRFTLQNIGLGAGGQDLALPNILRLWIGTDETDSFEKAQRSHPAIAVSGIKAPETKAPETKAPETKAPETKVPETKAPEINEPKTEEIVELQTQIDDCSPQAIAYTFNLLFTAGAVDVFSQPVTMKKNRLGTLLTVLCPTSKVADCEAILFQETTTLGIRRSTQQRTVLARKLISVPTDYGEITVKIAIANGKILNAHPEYDDCARAAQSFGVPLQVVQHAATQQLPSVPQVLASPVSAPL